MEKNVFLHDLEIEVNCFLHVLQIHYRTLYNKTLNKKRDFYGEKIFYDTKFYTYTRKTG